jgi:hypothetical protein
MMHRRGFRLPIAQVQGSVQLGALHPRGRAGDARDASQRDPGVRLGHVRVPPGTSQPRSSRDASHTRGGVSFFGAFRGLRVRSLSRPSVTRKSRDRVPERDRRARRARPRALDRAQSSIALGRSRARRPDRPESRLPASRARAPPPPPPRDADRGGCLSARFDAARNNTHLRFGEIARSRRKEKKKKNSL